MLDLYTTHIFLVTCLLELKLFSPSHDGKREFSACITLTLAHDMACIVSRIILILVDRLAARAERTIPERAPLLKRRDRSNRCYLCRRSGLETEARGATSKYFRNIELRPL